MLWTAGAMFTVSVRSMRSAIGRAFYLVCYVYAKLLILLLFFKKKL